MLQITLGRLRGVSRRGFRRFHDTGDFYRSGRRGAEAILPGGFYVSVSYRD